MVALWMLLGCPNEPCDAGTPSVAITHPDAPFVAIADGDELPAEMGPQGGWHVFVGVQVEGFDLAPDANSQSQLPAVTLTLSDGDDPVAGYAELPRVFSDSGTLVSERIVFVGDPYESAGRPLLLDAMVTDRCDASASFAREVTLTGL